MMNPLTYRKKNPFQADTGEGGLYLLTLDELKAVPVDGSTSLESIMGETRVWTGISDGDGDTRDFLLSGYPAALTAWGIRIKDGSQESPNE